MGKIRIIKLLLNNIAHENRDKREISVLVNLGCEVFAMYPADFVKTAPQMDEYTHVQVLRPQISFSQHKVIRFVKVCIFWKRLIAKIIEIEPLIISCHDLRALFIGWLAVVFGNWENSPKLVYDAHEFEIGRNTPNTKKRLSRWSIRCLEGFLMRRSAFSMMVNDSIADEVQRIHGLQVRPIVVRNMSNYLKIDYNVCQLTRINLCQQLGLPTSTFLIMYHGGILQNRGIENLIRAAVQIDNVGVIIIGNGDPTYIKELQSLTGCDNSTDKVLFLPAVQISELWQYIGAVNLGSVLLQNVCPNHYFSLPNKLFENIQAEIPVIASDFPEIRNIVNGYGLGLCCNPHDVDAIVSSILKIISNTNNYSKYKLNMAEAKKILSWENEQITLIAAYRGLFKFL